MLGPASLAGFTRWPSAILWLALGAWALAAIPSAYAQNAASLQARHASLREALASNPFQRPLYLESSQALGGLQGDIYARIGQPYAVVGPALQGMDSWCDILILHLNVKGCSASAAKAGDTLSVDVGRKFDQPLADAHRVEFRYAVATAGRDYLRVALNADKGPMGTSRYRIVLEAVALDPNQTFLHLAYSYDYGMAARLATQGYLATIGRDKVGFSIVGRKANGQPEYLGGVRGVVERNTMRYYLAIEAYLGALSAPVSARLDKRLNDWHAGTERYSVQLHELDRAEYLAMKHKEVRRQQALRAAAVAS